MDAKKKRIGDGNFKKEVYTRKLNQIEKIL